MQKKRSIDKKLVREMLEEEELLIDTPKGGKTPKLKKASPKKEEIMRHLMKEAAKEYSDEDEKHVQQLLTRVPQAPKEEPEFVKQERASDLYHRLELMQALEDYPRVHRLRLLKVLIVTLILATVTLYILYRIGLFDSDGMTGLIALIKT